MGYFAGVLLIIVFILPYWWLWRLNQKQLVQAVRLSWLETILKRQGISISNRDYIKYCYLTEGRRQAISEYKRIFHTSEAEAAMAISDIEDDLRKKRH